METDYVGDRALGTLDRAFGRGYFVSVLHSVTGDFSVGVEWHKTDATAGNDLNCTGLVDPEDCVLLDNVETHSSYFGFRLGWTLERELNEAISVGVRPAFGAGLATITERFLTSNDTYSETDPAVLGGVEIGLAVRPFDSPLTLSLMGGPDLIFPLSTSCEDCRNYVHERWTRVRLGAAVSF